MAKILKVNTFGIIEVAISDTDYASQATEESIAAQAQISVNDAAFSAGIASNDADSAIVSAQAALDSKVIAAASELLASVADTEASLALLAMKFLLFITGDITAEALARMAKAAYYAGLADASAKEATDIVNKAGFKVITKQISGIPGAAGAAGETTLLINANVNLNGNELTNISQSPEDDNDAVSAKFYWDLFNDNIELKWS